MWRRTLLTGWARKHSGSSGELDGVLLPQGGPGRDARKSRYVTAATDRCMEPMRRCLVNDRERQRSVRLPGKAPPAQKGAGGRHRSRTIQRRPLHSDVVHGERGASERVDQSGCSRKQRSLLTPGRANGRGWSDGGDHTSEKMPGSVANAARGIVNGHAPSGNV
jgi:hypothetical protein